MTITDFEKDLIFQIRAYEAFEHIKKICEIAPQRWPGTDDEQKGINCILEKLKEYGLETKIDHTKISKFIRGPSSVEVIAPVHKEIQAYSCIRSAITPLEGITANLEYVGFGREEDYSNKDVEGKIVLIERGKVRNTLKVDKASEKGANGFIMAGLIGHPFPPYQAALHRFGSPIPAVTISYENANFLKEMLKKQEVTVNLKVDGKLEDGSTTHVLGIINGEELPDEAIVVLTHHDTSPGPGANDNLSGVSVSLEIARVLSKQRPKRSIWFLFTGANEGCGLGAYDYVEKNLDEIQEKVKAVIEMDMVAAGKELSIVTECREVETGEEGLSYKTSKKLNEFIRNVSYELGYTRLGSVTQTFGVSDEVGFIVLAKVPTSWLWKLPDPYYHTVEDIPENLPPNTLKVAGEIVGISTWRLANMEILSL